MSRSRRKPSNHPIYPRPVSPLHYEPVHARSEDVLWDDSGTSGSDAEARLAKRRRIEKLGESYLRGEGLFILSAGIRGPLEEGWRNPWKKKRRRRRRRQRSPEDVRALAETSVKASKSREVPETVERAPSGVVEEDSLDPRLKLLARTSLPAQHDPFASKDARSGGDKPSEYQDKTAWLKEHLTLSSPGRFDHEDARQLQRSPSTRAPQPQRPRANVPPRARQASSVRSAQGPGAIRFPSHRAEEAIKLLRRRSARSKQDVATNLDADYLERGAMALTDHPQTDPSFIPQRVASSELSKPTTTSFEKNVEDKQPLQCDLQENASGQAGDVQRQSGRDPISISENQAASRVPEAMPSLVFSTETSSTTIFNTMPSAQPAVTLFAVHPNESLPSTGDMLSEKVNDTECGEEISSHLSTQAAIDAANLQLQGELTTPYATRASISKPTSVDASTRSRAKFPDGISPFSAFNGPNDRTSMGDSMRTQELLDAVTPYEFSTTVKKVPLNAGPDQDSPTNLAVQSTKNKNQTRVRKRAFFAPDPSRLGSTSSSSQGSIKARLKVSKHRAGNTDPATNKRTKADDDGYGDDDDNHHSTPSWPPPDSGPLPDSETSVDPAKDHHREEKPDQTSNPNSHPSDSKSSLGQDAQQLTPRPLLLFSPHRHHLHLLHRIQAPDDIKTDPAHRGTNSPSQHQHQPQQDQHQPQTQNSQPFDLSAALADADSFLQTWNTDR